MASLHHVVDGEQEQRHPGDQRPARRRPPAGEGDEQQQDGKGEPAAHGLTGLRREHRRHFFPYLRSEEHTSELQSLMRISYAVFCMNKTNTKDNTSYICI